MPSTAAATATSKTSKNKRKCHAAITNWSIYTIVNETNSQPRTNESLCGAPAYLSFHLVNVPRCWSVFYFLSIHFSQTSGVRCVRCAITVPFFGRAAFNVCDDCVLLLLSNDDIVLCADERIGAKIYTVHTVQYENMYTYHLSVSPDVSIYVQKINVLHNWMYDILYLARMVLHEHLCCSIFNDNLFSWWFPGLDVNWCSVYNRMRCASVNLHQFSFSYNNPWCKPIPNPKTHATSVSRSQFKYVQCNSFHTISLVQSLLSSLYCSRRWTKASGCLWFQRIEIELNTKFIRISQISQFTAVCMIFCCASVLFCCFCCFFFFKFFFFTLRRCRCCGYCYCCSSLFRARYSHTYTYLYICVCCHLMRDWNTIC